MIKIAKYKDIDYFIVYIFRDINNKTIYGGFNYKGDDYCKSCEVGEIEDKLKLSELMEERIKLTIDKLLGS